MRDSGRQHIGQNHSQRSPAIGERPRLCVRRHRVFARPHRARGGAGRASALQHILASDRCHTSLQWYVHTSSLRSACCYAQSGGACTRAQCWQCHELSPGSACPTLASNQYWAAVSYRKRVGRMVGEPRRAVRLHVAEVRCPESGPSRKSSRPQPILFVDAGDVCQPCLARAPAPAPS